MKSIPKLIRRFVGIMMISTMLLVILNIAFYIIMFWKVCVSRIAVIPYLMKSQLN